MKTFCAALLSLCFTPTSSLMADDPAVKVLKVWNHALGENKSTKFRVRKLERTAESAIIYYDVMTPAGHLLPSDLAIIGIYQINQKVFLVDRYRVREYSANADKTHSRQTATLETIFPERHRAPYKHEFGQPFRWRERRYLFVYLASNHIKTKHRLVFRGAFILQRNQVKDANPTLQYIPYTELPVTESWVVDLKKLRANKDHLSIPVVAPGKNDEKRTIILYANNRFLTSKDPI